MNSHSYLDSRPCSVHDVDAALEYAGKLKVYADQAKGDLHIMMRVYFEKSNTYPFHPTRKIRN